MNIVRLMFQRQLDKLKRHELKETDFMQEITKALQLREPKNDKEKELAKLRNVHLEQLIEKYREENGNNAYALLNVLTDYASRPAYTLTPLENNEDTLERRVGTWMMKYTETA